ncbi:DNA gyrase subunit A [Candidatus Dojkabacteria bacterium]|nr:DNA gyrase subunit A [Candidatus Dojkabacteria bacterium]
MSDVKDEIIKRSLEEVVETPQTDANLTPEPVSEVLPEVETDGDGGGDDDDLLNYTSEFKPGEIADSSISDEMKSRYLDYSMSVIVSRALPEVKDGLKPSQRRILVAMNDMNLTPSAHYRKSAKIAGDTSGNYHPHGEVVIYPTMVKMAQDFSTRYPLVDGQGNFGSIDGDPAAAMRYTEAKMSKIALELLKDLEKGTVPFILNYDGTRLEPTVLPAAIPQLLTNGSDGIAVGMATKIPPHNLSELVKALREMIKKGNAWKESAIYDTLRIEREKGERIPMTLDPRPVEYLGNYINKFDLNFEEKVHQLKARLKAGEHLYPEFKSEITPEELMDIVPGPDFPTGGIIYDRNEILNAYSTGRGRILQRAKASIEEGSKGKFQIIVTEIPYQVNKAYLIEKIADLVKDKKVEGISDIRDESNREGMRVVIILKKDVQPKAILNKLYKYTEMQKVFNANMIALVEQEPKTLPLKQMLELFLSFRISVVIRRFEFDLAESRYRAHILEGLLKALDILDEIIATIRGSKTQEEAKTNLIEKYEFTEVQAQAILEMQLRKLAALEREKLQNEFKELTEKIKEYIATLADPSMILKVIDGELAEVLEKHGDARRSKVIKGKVDEISEEDMVASEDTLVTLSHSGYIKRIPPDTYRTQNRGGKGVTGATTKEDDWISHAILCNTHDDLMFFSNKGRVFRIRAFEIPEYGRTAKGIPIVNLITLEQGELVTSVLNMSRGTDEKGAKYMYLFMATRKGTVKKTDISDFDKIRATGLIAAKLEGNDELLTVEPTSGEHDIILVTKEGKNIRFKEEDVRPTGRNTMGVRGIKFAKENDEVISMEALSSDEGTLLTISEFGFGKKSKLSGYATQGRGGSGVFTFRVNGKTGKLVVAKVIGNTAESDIVLISEKGVIIRTQTKDLPTLGRQTSGVKVMNVGKEDKVSAMAVI